MSKKPPLPEDSVSPYPVEEPPLVGRGPDPAAAGLGAQFVAAGRGVGRPESDRGVEPIGQH